MAGSPLLPCSPASRSPTAPTKETPGRPRETRRSVLVTAWLRACQRSTTSATVAASICDRI
eukprot:1204068-Lingulodinium_polyedra.AAC.1